MQSIQTLLWRGLTDGAFESRLIEQTREVLEASGIGALETSALTVSPAHSLLELANRVEEWRRGEPMPYAASEPAVAHYAYAAAASTEAA